MAETLLAIVLVTSSASGSGLICRWPPSPQASPRLARPRPSASYDPDHYDDPWRSANFHEGCAFDPPPHALDEWEYIWQRPHAARDRSHSFSRSTSHSTPSGRASPTKDGSALYDLDDAPADAPLHDEYGALFGYAAEFLAGLLLPKRALCHQKFALSVDDLFFVGHPVCADADGTWRFKQEKDVRGRGARKRRTSGGDVSSSTEFDSASALESDSPPPTSSWLQTFHVAFVHEVPDPSSSASGNIGRYFDVIYQQIAFTLTAVLFQEQVLSNFVEKDCDVLCALKDEFASKGACFCIAALSHAVHLRPARTYEEYMNEALLVSSIAPAMKTLYESIKSRSLAHLTIHNLPLELQLPPHLDALLHSTDDDEFAEYDEAEANDGVNTWGPEFSIAWRLPALEPWKSLLLLSGPDSPGHEWTDVYAAIRGTNVREEDKLLAEQLIRFLETVDITLSYVGFFLPLLIVLNSFWT